MVRAHRQAWCWQDEWYGLTMDDIRQLELETQLTLARKMAQFSQAEEATEANGGSPSPDKDQEVKEAISSIEAEEVVVSSGGETLQPRGVLTKQWSTSSRSSRSSKRGGEEHAMLIYSPVSPLCIIACETGTGVTGIRGSCIHYVCLIPIWFVILFYSVALHIILPLHIITSVFTLHHALKLYLFSLPPDSFPP